MLTWENIFMKRLKNIFDYYLYSCILPLNVFTSTFHAIKTFLILVKT